LTAFAQYDGTKMPSFGFAMGQQANQLVQNEDYVTLNLYVLDARSNNGQSISGVTVAVMDAAGNEFEKTTDSNGAVVFNGQPGTWQFVLYKEGYKTAKMVYNVTKSQTAAAYLQEADQQAKMQSSSQYYGQVTLTISVHEASINGELLSGVQITGNDAAGNAFEAVTDSSGSAVIDGVPGTWLFNFAKEGYQSVSLDYNVSETHEAAAYLLPAASSAPMQPADQNKELVALTVYVHEGSVNGELLSGVQITGNDAAGNAFEAVTDSSGSAVIDGVPGTWLFNFAKEGYQSVSLDYNVSETHEAAAYLLPAASSAPMQPADQNKELVALTVYVHEGSVNGELLSGVQITGNDAAGNAFEAVTDSSGSAVIDGVPGTWLFNFAKEGYQSVSLDYNVSETHEAAAYLQPAAKQAA